MNQPVLPSVEIGTGERLLDRYEILRELGRGGCSVVYAARDHEIGTDVALKVLVPPPASATEARERMRREVAAIRGLRHPSVVGVHDFLEQGAISFVVMDLIDGPDLATRLRTRGPLTVEETIGLGREIGDALAAAHAAGILHRDVKPANILLDRTGRALLADFGSARLETQATMTRTGGWVGTLSYLAPEVWLGDRADARADVFALGTTLFEALTARLPDRPSPHLPPTPEGDGFRPARLQPVVPPWLDQVIGSATAADPRYRFANARALADALANRGAGVRAIGLAEEGTGEAAAPPKTLPVPFVLLLVAVLACGAWAGLVVSPAFGLSSPIMAWLLYRSARRTVAGQPASAGREQLARPAWAGLPPGLAQRLAALPPGTARTLVADVLVLARAHLDRATGRAAERRREELRPLVESAVEAGIELAEVDETLIRMERDRFQTDKPPEAWWDGITTLERARDGLSSVLLELIGALGMAQGAAVDDFDAARGRLRELLDEHRRDAGFYLAASHQLGQAEVRSST